MMYKILVEDRKEITQQMEALTGEKPSYTRAPRFAYILRGIAVEKNGTVTTDEDADLELVGQLIEAGLIEAPDGIEVEPPEADTEAEEEAEAEPEQAEESSEEEAEAEATETDEAEENAEAENEDADAEDAETEEAEEQEASEDTDGYGSIVAHETHMEPVKPTFSFPLSHHRTESILNLVFTIYSKGSLISKATQGEFTASEELVETLQSGRILRIEEALEAISDAGEGALKGLSFEKDKVSFDGFPATDDQATMDAWLALATAINKTAIKQNRIRAKVTDESNEKFAFRTWLTRLGMNGADMKEERNILYRHLSGHTAFRTPADQEKWTKRQNEKRDALRALKEAAEEEAANLEQESVG